MNLKLSILVLVCLIGLSFSQFRARNLQGSLDPNSVNQIVQNANNTNPGLVANATSIASSIWNVSQGTVNETALNNDILVSPNGNGTNTVNIFNGNASLVFTNVSDDTVQAIQWAYGNITQNVNTSQIAQQVGQELTSGTVNTQSAFLLAFAAISNTSANWSNETKAAVDQAVNNVTEYLNNQNNTASNSGSNATQGLEGVYNNLTSGANSTLSGLFHNLTTSIENSTSAAINNSITSAVNSATNAATNAVGNAVSGAVGNLFGSGGG